MSRLLHILDPKGCGLGKGPKCCAYLLAIHDGWLCGRETPVADHLRGRVARGTISAQRLPERPYPDCQREGL